MSVSALCGVVAWPGSCWLNPKMSIFHPEHVLHSATCASWRGSIGVDACSQRDSGWGFSRLIELSPADISRVATGDVLDRWAVERLRFRAAAHHWACKAGETRHAALPGPCVVVRSGKLISAGCAWQLCWARQANRHLMLTPTALRFGAGFAWLSGELHQHGEGTLYSNPLGYEQQ